MTREIWIIRTAAIISMPTYIVRLDIPVHDTHAMAVVQGLQELVQIIPDIVVRQCL